MTVVNKVIDFGSKFILVVIGFAVALLPIVYLLANQTLHHQEWKPAFEKHEVRLQEIQEVLPYHRGYLYLRNVTAKVGGVEFKETGEFADYVCYLLQKKGEVVVRKNLQSKIKRKTKKGQESESNEETNTVSTLIEVPVLGFLRKEISKFIDFQHESLSRKHWVIVSLGELQQKYLDEMEKIKEKNPEYKFTIVSAQKITGENQKEQPQIQNIQQNQATNKQEKGGKGKKNGKVKKVKVVDEQVQTTAAQTKNQKQQKTSSQKKEQAKSQPNDL